jgi:hypothetical protein
VSLGELSDIDVLEHGPEEAAELGGQNHGCVGLTAAVRESLGVTYPTARSDLRKLEKLGILVETEGISPIAHPARRSYGRIAAPSQPKGQKGEQAVDARLESNRHSSESVHTVQSRAHVGRVVPGAEERHIWSSS